MSWCCCWWLRCKRAVWLYSNFCWNHGWLQFYNVWEEYGKCLKTYIIFDLYSMYLHFSLIHGLIKYEFHVWIVDSQLCYCLVKCVHVGSRGSGALGYFIQCTKWEVSLCFCLRPSLRQCLSPSRGSWNISYSILLGWIAYALSVMCLLTMQLSRLKLHSCLWFKT